VSNPLSFGFAARAAGAVLVRPSLWTTAVRELHRMTPPAWWRRAPFLPVPDRDYLRFRLVTQYGNAGPVDEQDVVTFLRWCRSADR
jgi:hypothetical protein